MGEGRGVKIWRRGRGRQIDEVDRQTDKSRAMRAEEGTQRRTERWERERLAGICRSKESKLEWPAVLFSPHLKHLEVAGDPGRSLVELPVNS